jgi:hypothetical protein
MKQIEFQTFKELRKKNNENEKKYTDKILQIRIRKIWKQ